MPETFSEIILHVDDRVAQVVINRPDKRNSLSKVTISELGTCLEHVANNPEIRVVELSGAGDKAFCSGADLSTMFGGEPGAQDPVANHLARGSLANLFTQIWDLGKPVIAKVSGFCLAGGFGLAMACDIVYCSNDSVFGTPEINVGLWPYMITVPLLNSMPPKVALELMMTGRRVGAQEAYDLGFVNKVFETGQLDEQVARICRQLASRSPQAMKLGRGSFYSTLSGGRQDSLRYLQAMLSVTATSADAQEGIAAFLDKRQPNWEK